MKIKITYKFLYLTLFASSIFCLTSCAKEDPIPEEDILDQIMIGNWEGLVFQEGVGTWEIDVAIRQPSDDGVAGNGNYDEECTFSWNYVKKEGETYMFDEVILSGRNICIDGIMRVTVVDRIELKLDWIDKDDEENIVEGRIFRS